MEDIEYCSKVIATKIMSPIIDLIFRSVAITYVIIFSSNSLLHWVPRQSVFDVMKFSDLVHFLHWHKLQFFSWPPVSSLKFNHNSKYIFYMKSPFEESLRSSSFMCHSKNSLKFISQFNVFIGREKAQCRKRKKVQVPLFPKRFSRNLFINFSRPHDLFTGKWISYIIERYARAGCVRMAFSSKRRLWNVIFLEDM